MTDHLDDVEERLLQGEERVVREARWFYEDFTGTDSLSLPFPANGLCSISRA
jgi:hypothetical protein